jgi:hypothetical protein
MKSQFHIILLCLAGFALTIGCEKAILQQDQSISSRGDCDECPENDECCCAISLQATDDEAFLLICGSTSGFSTCYKPGTTGCDAFNGVTYTITLFDDDRLPFCALISGPFWIKNTSTTDDAEVIITCQNGETTPQTIQVDLGPTEERYFENNGSCEIGPCS